MESPCKIFDKARPFRSASRIVFMNKEQTPTGLPWRTAWITGASSGIGLELARQLAAAGVRVAVSSRRPMPAMAGVTDFPCDVTSEHAVARTVAAIGDCFETIDLVILAAGLYEATSGGRVDVPQHTRHFAVNYFGVVNCLAEVLPRLKAQGKGCVAIVSSVAGYRGLPRSGAYGPTKAALINLAENLKLELADTGVSIHVVNPGFVETPMTRVNDFPMPFLITAEDAARRILLGLTAGRFEVAFPRRFVTILKLARILPYALYFPLARRLDRKNVS